MRRRLLIAFAAIAAIAGGFAALALGEGSTPMDRVAVPKAKSSASIQSVTVPNGSLQLKAVLARPAGNNQRFPAVVLLHGCSGLWSTKSPSKPQSHIKRWLADLQQRGYVAIAVDSFGARGVKRVCNTPPSKTHVSEVTDRVGDAFAALNYLRTLRYVSPQRVAVLGWSNGGSTALASVGKNAPVNPPPAGGFRTAVAFYPGCGLRSAFKRYTPTVPTRILAASKDPLAAGCRGLAKHAGKQLSVTVYRGARHSFDESTVHAKGDRSARKRADAAALAAIAGVISSTTGGQSIFSLDSWVNAALPAGAALAPDQTAAASFAGQVKQFGTWVNTTTWSAPVYVVGPDQPRVDVSVQTERGYSGQQAAELAADFKGVPLPSDATPGGPPETFTNSWSDLELILYQPSTDTAWEFYHLVRDGLNGSWSAMDGGKISHLSTSLGQFDPWPSGSPHGMTASAIPLLAGLQRVDELQHGSIDHVVAVALPHVRQGTAVSPAVRTDGNFTTPDAIPEGTLFRLPADLDIDSLPLTPYAKIVAHAIQTHGLVVVDRDCRPQDAKCPAVTFAAEDPRPKPDGSHANPYDAIFGGVPAERLFDNFPWDKLQVVSED